MIRVHETDLHGVLRIELDCFEDHRGQYIELFDSETYREATGDIEFVQDDVSISYHGVLRGLHGDWKTTKLITVLAGTGYALIADNREDSPTYRQWQGFLLSRASRTQLLLPPGIGNSIVSLSEELVYYYKQDTHFVHGQQFTIRWDDPEWEFEWPVATPILSDRDREGDYTSTMVLERSGSER